MAVRWIETRVATVGATETKESPSSVRWWILFGILGGVVLLSRSKSFGTPLVGNPSKKSYFVQREGWGKPHVVAGPFTTKRAAEKERSAREQQEHKNFMEGRIMYDVAEFSVVQNTAIPLRHRPAVTRKNTCVDCELAENPTRSQWALLAAAVTGGAALWLYKKKKSGTWTKVDMSTYCFVPGKTYRFSLPSGHGDSEMVVQEAALAFGSKFSTTTRDGRTYFEGVWAHKPICPNQTGKQHIWAEVKS